MNYPIQKIGIVMLCLIFAGTSAKSQKQEDKTLSPYFFVKSENPATDRLPLKETFGEVNIVGVIADVTITQVYKNEGQNTLEAIYTFPTSTKAAIYAMEMVIGDRKITAKIEEKKKARADYEEAKAGGKRTSLLEQQRPNVFQMNVANILPGDVIEVKLKYTEMLIPEKGIYEFVYPTVVVPRYTGGSDPTDPTDQFSANPYQKQGKMPLYKFGMKIFLSTGVPIQSINCKSHTVLIDYPTLDKAQISLDNSEINGGNRDFILNYSLAGEQITSGIMLYEHEDENFFLAMIQPPAKIREQDIPPREYIFIVDVSGSMRGYPLEVSKKLLRNLVTNLRPSDRFNVLLFAGTSGWLNEESVYANAVNINRAIRLIDNQSGGGGTNLLPALRIAFSMPRHEEALSRSFVVVTDGYVMIERQAFDLIREHCNEANVFAFGIGNGVNRYLIEGLAHVGQSEPMIVTSQDQAHRQAEKFRQYINRPVLTQIKVDFGNMEIYDVEPVSVADVMAERPIILFGKYSGDPKGQLTIKGYSGNKKYKAVLNFENVEPTNKNAAIRYLWARERIKLIDDYSNLRRLSEDEKEVTKLGLKYNLMTAYTSFIAIDEMETVDSFGNLVKVKQALPLPKGVPNSAIGFELDDCMSFVSGVNMEIVEEDFEISMPMVNTSLYGDSDVKVSGWVEEKLLAKLEQCFEPEIYSPDEIEISVDSDGKVVTVKIFGVNVSEKLKQCIRQKIANWDFKYFGINQEWKIQIFF